jgi:hypothetical protein
MGHISAKQLVQDNIITGIELDTLSKPTHCEACTKAKSTKHPVPKEQVGNCCTGLGNKIHSDVLGLATPRSYNQKDYFVSFTDDHS